jgi:two-component system, OmpR family, response regulator
MMDRGAGGLSHRGDELLLYREGEGRDRIPELRQSESGGGATTDQPVRICIVEDDPVMLRTVSDYLEQHNMRAAGASGRHAMIAHFAVREPDLVILDLRLGQEEGFDLLREIRSRSGVPVIILTDERRDEIDRVVALELGADDCLTKPFSLRELLARIRAVLRRQEAGRAASQRDPERGRFRFGGWQLDRRIRRLVDPNGSQVVLTKSEYALLTAFIDSPRRPLSREQLLQATRVHEDIFDRSIDVQILRLRRKLELDPSAPQIIQTERGFGYLFALPVERLFLHVTIVTFPMISERPGRSPYDPAPVVLSSARSAPEDDLQALVRP